MKQKLLLPYAGSFLLLAAVMVGTAVAARVDPIPVGALRILTVAQPVAAGLVLVVTCRSLLLPLLHLDERTSAVLDSLELSSERTGSGTLLDRFQAVIDREYDTRSAFRQAELDALQSQINPHFLYNTLECIRGQAIVEGNRAIADMSKALSQFFRYSINRTNALVTVSDELRNVAAYMKIQNYRFGEKYELRTHMEPEDEGEISLCLMPRLTLQPLVENALQHGLRDSVRDREYLDVTLELTDVRLILSIIDHGVGMPPQQLDQLNGVMCGELPPDTAANTASHSGIALSNINERIQLLFGRDYGLRLFSTPGVGTKVEIVLPIRHSSATE